MMVPAAAAWRLATAALALAAAAAAGVDAARPPSDTRLGGDGAERLEPGGAAAPPPALRQPADAALRQPADAAAVHTVHLLFSHHLDVGLDIGLKLTEDCVGFATKIVQRYFDDFIPRAIRLGRQMEAGPDKFAYTIHPWIASLYVDCVPWYTPDSCPLNPGRLRCPDKAAVAQFDEAVAKGWLLWADSPMNLDSGVVGEPGMFEDLLDIAGALNERYNISKPARVWSNVDVPGFSRSSIPLLRRAGANFLSIGENGHLDGGGGPSGNSSTPLEVVGDRNATLFRWHDPVSTQELVVMHHRGYGGYSRPDACLITPGGVALASHFASDNTGPPLSVSEVRQVFNTVRKVFPNAKVFGSTFDQFAAEIKAAEIAALPVMSSEWGDQWLTGMSTDPVRLATYRAIARARATCIDSGACHRREPVLRNLTRFAAKISEHTQGLQNEAWSPGVPGCTMPDGSFQSPCPEPGDSHWSNEAFHQVHNVLHNAFKGADDSWIEARLFNTLAIEAVPPSHPLAPLLQKELAALVPHLPATPLPPRRTASKFSEPVVCGAAGMAEKVTMSFDPMSGSVRQLGFGKGGAWSELMDLRYITYSAYSS